MHMSIWRVVQGAVAPASVALLVACGGEDGRSLRDELSRLPQDTSSLEDRELEEERTAALDSVTAPDFPDPQTLPDTIGFFDGPAPGVVQPDTGPRGLAPAPPSDTRPWIPEGPDSLPLAGEWTTGSINEPTANARMTVLGSVRTARNDGFDRVVFEFLGPRVPGFTIEYIQPPVRQCGSGQPVPLNRGDAWLRVRLEPSQAHDDRGRATVEDRVRRTELPLVREMQLICDYEGQVEWVLGIRDRRPVRVTRLSSPTRLIVDVRH